MRETQELDVLAVAPHPDDVELFCGGTIAKMAKLGHRVGIVDLTRGELASNGTPEQRAIEASEASRALGLTQRFNLGLPDGFIANALASDGPELGAQGPVSRLVDLIRTARPTLVFSPSKSARHPDHVATARLVERAVFFAGVKRYPALSDASAFRPKRVIHYLMRVGVQPDFVVDVSEVYEIKRRAISCYGSQVTRDPQAASTLANAPKSHAALTARDQMFGGLIGVDYAEGFYLDGTLHIEDPVSHFMHSEPATLFGDSVW